MAAIGTLSLVLAAGLQIIGLLPRFDKLAAALVSRGGAEPFPQRLPAAVPWIAAAVIGYALAFAILATPGTGRRAILWVTTVILVTTWAPVLSLASYFPNIGAAWITAAWSGVCAIVYARNHVMPAETTASRR